MRLALGEDVEGVPPKLESEPIVETNSSKLRLSLWGGKKGLFNAETLIYCPEKAYASRSVFHHSET